MIDTLVKIQFSVFGDFQEFKVTPKVITELMDLFKDFKDVLTPSARARFVSSSPNSIKQNTGLDFMNQDGSFLIQFNDNRIDITKTPINSTKQVDLNTAVSEFETESIQILEKIFLKYESRAKRIALIQQLLSRELSENKMNTVFSNIFRLDDEIMNNEKREWNFRVTNRIPYSLSKHSEGEINSIVAINRNIFPFSTTPYSPNRLLFNLDCNTKPENQKERFDISDIKEFYQKISKYQKEKIEIITKHIDHD